jgi:hypothetical protein
MGVQFGPSVPLSRIKLSEAVEIVSGGSVGCIGSGGSGAVFQELRSTNNAIENPNHDLERTTGNRAHVERAVMRALGGTEGASGFAAFKMMLRISECAGFVSNVS